MTFRVLASLVLGGGTLALLGGLSALGASPFATAEARHLRAMKARTDAPRAVVPMTLADFAALPHDLPLGPRAALERRGVVFEGWNQNMILAGDGDVHLELAASPRVNVGYDTVYVTAELTPQWRQRTPGWRWDRLLETFRPNHGGATEWDGSARRVRVTGWLLYDYQYDHVPSPWTLVHAAPRISGWEIHPVTRIERWESARGWIEVGS